VAKNELPPIAQGWREAAQKGERRRSARHEFARQGGKGKGGISFQLPPGWDDGSGKIRHIESGPHKGRVYFTSRTEAREIAKRMSDTCDQRVRYDE
jgi:hypothetical protein